MTRRSRVLLGAEAGGWWIVLWGVWVLTVPAFSLAETVVAAVATVPAAIAAVAARRAERVAWHPSPSALRGALVWPVAVLCDTVRVVAAVLTRRAGDGAVTELRLPDEPAEGEAARGAFTTLLLGSTPSSVVVDVPRGTRLRVHYLAQGRPRTDRWVAR